jgi:hypothetical protein
MIKIDNIETFEFSLIQAENQTFGLAFAMNAKCYWMGPTPVTRSKIREKSFGSFFVWLSHNLTL